MGSDLAMCTIGQRLSAGISWCIRIFIRSWNLILYAILIDERPDQTFEKVKDKIEVYTACFRDLKPIRDVPVYVQKNSECLCSDVQIHIHTSDVSMVDMSQLCDGFSQLDELNSHQPESAVILP